MHSIMQAVARRLATGVAALALVPAGAMAQTAPDADTHSTPSIEDIIVTGTLLRGSAPVGSPIISLGEEKLKETGATSSNELLATIPQVTNFFNNVPNAQLARAVNQLQISRPELRNLLSPSAASSATLILVDGHRVAGIGVNQSSIDPDLIPTGAIERVEVVTDGGSATYGADAVGGVINFITRKRFDGVKVDGRYGFADDYYTTDANLTVGKDWGSGSLYASYTFAKNDMLFGRDREFISGKDYATATPTLKGRQCAAPNVTIGAGQAARNYGYPSSTPGSVNTCDPTDNKSFVPASERHGGIVGLYQELNDRVSINVRGFYSDRKTRGTDELAANFIVTSANPYMFVPAGTTRPASETVNLSFAPLLGVDSARFGTDAQEWGVNSEFKVALDDNWQVRTLLNYSRSNSNFYLNGTDPNALTAAGADSNPATAINPFNLAATNPATIAAIRNRAIQGQARDEVLNARAIVDGSLFKVPGGDVRVALGYEFIRDNFQQRYSSGAPIGALASMPFGKYGRSVQAVFGEVQIPVFGADNAVPGIQSFVISASGRYDHYSDFGSTFNPKIGATYKPVSWLALRGNWGTSYNAPAPLDQLGSQRNSIGSFAFLPFIRPGDNIGFFGGYTIGLQGSNPGLKPQTADTWSIGADIIDPPFLPGLRASVSYYNVKFKDLLSTPTPDAGIFGNFPANVTTSTSGLSADVVRAFAAQDPGGLAIVNPLIASNQLIYALVDFRVGNYGILNTSGLDFNVSYRHDTGFGAIDAGVSGNYQLTRKTQTSPSAPVRDQLVAINSIQQNATPRLQLQGSLGATIGKLRAQATLNHTGGYAVAPIAGIRPQDHIGSYDTVNLFFKYDVPGDSKLLQDLSFTLNVNNVFDQDPPEYRNTPDSGFINAFTLGRLVMFGVSKKF